MQIVLVHMSAGIICSREITHTTGVSVYIYNIYTLTVTPPDGAVRMAQKGLLPTVSSMECPDEIFSSPFDHWFCSDHRSPNIWRKCTTPLYTPTHFTHLLHLSVDDDQ